MSDSWRRSACVLAVTTSFLIIANGPVVAQQRERLEKTDSPVVIEGSVREIFKSPRQGRTDYLLQIDVQKSEARKALAKGTQVRFPAPGELVYVHISQSLDNSGRTKPEASYQRLPEERAQIRAYLTPRESGGWEGIFPDWFELTGDAATTNVDDDSAPVLSDITSEPAGKSSLGITTEVVKVQNRVALRVTSVERNGPAQKAGLEVGDVIAGINGEALTSERQLESMGSKGKKFTLIVVDVNTGRGAQVEIDPATSSLSLPEISQKETPPADSTAAPATQPAKVSLGISAEPVTLGTRSALKVTGVNPDSPAGKAGLEVGDIIVSANGAPLTGPEQLIGVLRKSGSTLKLTVRDSRTGRDTDVTVNLKGQETDKSLPVEVTTPANASPGKLGAVTELAFNDDDFAVKITEVEPGSAAARAGLKPGIMILSANGKPVLHPNDLNDAVRASSGSLKLVVFNPSTGKKGNLDVDLGK